MTWQGRSCSSLLHHLHVGPIKSPGESQPFGLLNYLKTVVESCFIYAKSDQGASWLYEDLNPDLPQYILLPTALAIKFIIAKRLGLVQLGLKNIGRFSKTCKEAAAIAEGKLEEGNYSSA